MSRSKRKLPGLKIALLVVVVFVACFSVFSWFLTRIDAKIEAIEMVKARHLHKERLDSFVSRVNREGKFKLLGWDIEPADKDGTFIVSYRLRRLNEEGFMRGPEEGYWYRVDLQDGTCKQVFPPGTVTPED